MYSIHQAMSFVKERKERFKKTKVIKEKPRQKRHGGWYPLFQWMAGCCRPVVLGDQNQQGKMRSAKREDNTLNIKENDEAFRSGSDSELIQAEQYVNMPSVVTEPESASAIQEGLYSAVSIEPTCMTPSMASDSISDSLLFTAFRQPANPRCDQRQELHVQEVQNNMITQKGSHVRRKEGIVSEMQFDSPLHCQDPQKRKGVHQTSTRTLHDDPRYDSKRLTNGKAFVSPQGGQDMEHAEAATEPDALRILLMQKQYLINEIWHVTTALKHPGSGVGSSSGYQIEKDDTYQSLMNGSVCCQEKQDKFFSERRAMLALIDQEIQDVFISSD